MTVHGKIMEICAGAWGSKLKKEYAHRAEVWAKKVMPQIEKRINRDCKLNALPEVQWFASEDKYLPSFYESYTPIIREEVENHITQNPHAPKNMMR